MSVGLLLTIFMRVSSLHAGMGICGLDFIEYLDDDGCASSLLFPFRSTSDMVPWSLYSGSPLSSRPQPLGSGGSCACRAVIAGDNSKP